MTCYGDDEGFRAGSDANWEAFYDATQLKLRGSICRVGVRDADIDDVLQETFLRVFERRESIDLTRNVIGYVATTAYHIAIDHYRRDRRSLTTEIIEADTTDEQGCTALDRASSPVNVEDAAIAGLEVELVEGILSAICPNQRAAIRLSAMGFSLGDIAKMTNAPLGTVKGRHRLGRARLRGVLDGVMPRPCPGALQNEDTCTAAGGRTLQIGFHTSLPPAPVLPTQLDTIRKEAPMQ